jgi:hypothetical protein
MAYDFSSPVCICRIHVTGNNEMVVLNSAPVVLSSSASDNIRLGEYQMVTAASVNIGIGGVTDSITITLQANFERGIDIMDRTGLLDLFNVVSVKFGYSREEAFTPWYYGMVVQPPKVVLDPTSGWTCVITASVSAVAVRQTSNQTWKNVARIQVVREIGKNNGWLVDYTPTDKADFTPPMQMVGSWDQGGDTEWNFLQRILNEAKVKWYFGTDSATGKSCLFIKDNADAYRTQPVRTFVMKRAWSLSRAVYPLLRFECDTPTRWLSAVTAGIRMSDVELKTKEVKEVELNSVKNVTPLAATSTSNAHPENQVGVIDQESGLKPVRRSDGLYFYRPHQEELEWTSIAQGSI